MNIKRIALVGGLASGALIGATAAWKECGGVALIALIFVWVLTFKAME